MSLHARGRPRLAGRRPECPYGHGGKVLFAGFRKRRTDGLYARPRYRCVHVDHNAWCAAKERRTDKPCSGSHWFTGAEQTRTHAHPDGLWCRECDRDRSLRDGSSIALAWDYEARLIADALIAVGSGAPYRHAAFQMRVAARRYPPGLPLPLASRAGETIHRYLDHFGELVLADVDYEAWPDVLVLDALPLRKREVRPEDPFSYEISGNGAIFMAYGYLGPFPRRHNRLREDEPDDRRLRPRMRPQPWKIAVAGGVDRYSWLDFLASLPGKPRWIVTDGDTAVRLAVAMRWGQGREAPVVFSCEGHLGNTFRDRARAQDELPGIDVWRLWPDNRRVSDPMPGPLWSRDHYRAFLDAVLAYPPERVVNVSAWIRDNDRLIRRQFDLREAFPGLPRGTGAIEAGLVKVRDWLGTRSRVLQNVRRINVTLGLMRANLGGQADPARYSRLIRGELERTGGRPKLDWREHHYRGHVQGGQLNPEGSLFRLSDDARDGVEAARRSYWISAQAGTMARKVAVLNDYHFIVGAPPVELTAAATPAVKVRGRMVSDFPTFLDEWDPANPGDPYATPAGHDKAVGWICADNPAHRWRKSPSDRIVRLLGCRRCHAVRGIAAQVRSQKDPQVLRDALLAIRATVGPYDAPPVVTAAPALTTEALEVSPFV